MQIIRLETNRSRAVPQRSELLSLMSRVESEYSYLLTGFPPLTSCSSILRLHPRVQTLAPFLRLRLPSPWHAAIKGDVNRPSLMLTKPVADYAPRLESQIHRRGAASFQKWRVVVGKTLQMESRVNEMVWTYSSKSSPHQEGKKAKVYSPRSVGRAVPITTMKKNAV